MEPPGGRSGVFSREKRPFHVTRDFPVIFETYIDPILHILALLYLLATETGLIVTNPTKTMILQAVFVYVEWVMIYLLFLMDWTRTGGKTKIVYKWLPGNQVACWLEKHAAKYNVRLIVYFMMILVTIGVSVF